jgi:hypothetical protein
LHQLKGDFMPQPDREALIRSLKSHRDRAEARRSARPEMAAVYRQNRQEKLRILEEAAQESLGVNLRELRASLARNRKQTDEALAALRSGSAPQQPAQPSAPPPTSRLFQSLKPLAGRLVPLAQPSLVFLDAPDSFYPYETGGNWIWNWSIAPGDAFFQTDIHASSESDFGAYIFTYTWDNASDRSMLTTVIAGLSFTGWLSAAAQDGSAEQCWEAMVSAYLDAEVLVGATNTPIESRSSNVGFIVADNGFWGLDDGLAEQLYNNQDYSITIDSYLVPPNSKLTILVATAFSFDWGFNTPVSPAENNCEASFGNKLFSGNRVVSNGVIILASPVTST